MMCLMLFPIVHARRRVLGVHCSGRDRIMDGLSGSLAEDGATNCERRPSHCVPWTRKIVLQGAVVVASEPIERHQEYMHVLIAIVKRGGPSPSEAPWFAM